ncbi:hypothetical protein DFA_05261 [Cavenderia fasciculata]|uniref:UBR-type domain-containing protein n=1 Tax=Cavenderia fasciculata TaxID=261658 RepID=F4PNS8_CACFS|nr:uncharacterized protein DFA_05261 [Cavenderia fasciculata]EGG23131.1 hypothetical protein DFA_05261 [Cavenderia fasciculata]|eukprot:XP_004360982.1 hypothetical protein DFA_05261 [Cavenderia fasciculata]
MSELVTCTFVRTGKVLEVQTWYDCKTCGRVGSAGVCASCAVTCHAGHNLGPAKNSKFYCDCGFGTLKKDLSSSNNWFGQATTKLNEFKTKYQSIGSEAAIKFINETELVLILAQETIGNLTIEKEIEGGIKEMTPMVKALEGGLTRKDIKSVQNWMTQLTVKFVPFNERFCQLKSAQSFIDQVNAVWLRVDAELGELIAEQEIEKAYKEIEPMVGALQGAMTRQDVKSAINWTNQLRAKLDQFRAKYFAYQQSVRLIETTTTILLNAESQFHDLIEEEKIEIATKELVPMISALKGALERKDIKSIINWNNVLHPKFQLFTQLFGANPLAIRTIQQVTDLLSTINSQLGDTLQEQTINDTVQSLQITLNALLGAYERKDLSSLANWKNQFNGRYQEFKSRYGDSRYAIVFIQKAETALTQIQNELGSLLVEKEINDRIVIVKPQLQSLRGSFERKEIPSIIAKKNSLVVILNQVNSTYPANELVKYSVFKECQDLFVSIDQSLGATIQEKEIEDRVATMTITKKALQGAMERQDLNSCANWKRVLDQQYKPFLDSFQSNPLASRFIQETNEIVAKLDTQFGRDLLELTTKKLNDIQLKSPDLNTLATPSSTSSPATSTSAASAATTGEVQCKNKDKNRLKQDFYTCLTCVRDSFDSNKIVCPSCRDVCHAGHVMGPLIRAVGTCDCEKLHVGPCQCYDVKQYPRQEYQPLDWVKNIGIATDEEIKFIVTYYAYLIKIETRFKELGNDDREKKLEYISGLTDGVWSIGKQLGIDIGTSTTLKPFVEVVKAEFVKIYGRILNESWKDIINLYKKKDTRNMVQPITAAKANGDDADVVTRTVYLDYYESILPWLFIQGTPKGRELFNQSKQNYLANNALVKEPIQHVADYSKDSDQDKQLSEEFWTKFVSITKDDTPTFELIQPIDQLLKEYEPKLKHARSFLEHKLAAQDYLALLKSFESKRCAPEGYIKTFSWGDSDQDVLRAVFKKDWTRFFGFLKKLTSSCANAKDPRFTFFANEFAKTSTERLKAKTIPLVYKFENKGKTEKSGPIINELETNLKGDKDIETMTPQYNDIRKRRQLVYNQLVSIDKEFNKVLETHSLQFQQSITKAHLQQLKATVHTSLDPLKEVIPNITKFKGTKVELRDFDKEPTTQGVFGGWHVTWDKEIDGGSDYTQLQEISNTLLAQLTAKNQIPNDISKTGKDMLNTYLIKRASVLKGTGPWSASGTISGIHNYETNHYASSDSETMLQSQIPKEARNINMKKVLSHYTTTTEHVRHTNISIDRRTEHYTWSVSYVIDRVAVSIDTDSISCLYFSSVKGKSNSLSGIHQKLKDLLPKQ